MNLLKKNIRILGAVIFLPFLTGCAAGSATAGYALKAREADRLSAEGEERVVARAKREMLSEFCNRQTGYSCTQDEIILD